MKAAQPGAMRLTDLLGDTLEARDVGTLAILKLAEREAPYFLARYGLTGDEDGRPFWNMVYRLANAGRGKDGHAVEVDEQRIELFDKVIKAHREAASEAGIAPGELAADLSAAVAAALTRAAFYFGLALAAAYYRGGR